MVFPADEESSGVSARESERGRIEFGRDGLGFEAQAEVVQGLEARPLLLLRGSSFSRQGSAAEETLFG